MKKSLKILAAIAVTSLIAFNGCDNGGGVDPEVPVKPADVPNLTIDGVEIPFSNLVGIPSGTVNGSSDYAIASKNGVFTVTGRNLTIPAFQMGAYEVTMRLYKAVMQGDANADAEPSCCSNPNLSYKYLDEKEDEKDLRPVENVSWYGAVYFCNKLSEKTGKVPYYTITYTSTGPTVKQNTAEGASKGYRLPTEAEWEYAARGANPSASGWKSKFAGKASSIAEAINKDLDSVGWYRYNCETGTTDSNLPDKEGTHRVGLKAPVSDSLKLYDMSGNVREWCYDWYDTIKADTPFAGPSNSSRDARINRGGTFKDVATDCYVESRAWNKPDLSYGDLGFRICCSVED